MSGDHVGPRGGIVIVNWNGWGDVLECLEATFRLEDFDGPVVVCDNGSDDGSLLYIRAWAEDKLCALPESRADEIRALVVPPIRKPLGIRSMTQEELRAATAVDLQGPRLILINLEANLGYAAGNNAGLALLLKDPEVEWFWLLNSDALPVASSAATLAAMLVPNRLPMITGSVLLEYWFPDLIQACGARYNRLTGNIRHIDQGVARADFMGQNIEARAVDYPVGASLAVNRSFLKAVGLMSEDYFLYHEEIDWVMRHGWPSQASIVCQSFVYHKGGKATGAGKKGAERGLVADYYFLRSRLLLARKSSRLYFVSILAITCIAAVRRLARPISGGFNNALVALRDAVFGKIGKRS